MTMSPAGPSVFFLERAMGQRFCLLHAPQGSCRGAVLYIHPFAEEMNKSRRTAAEQARALSAAGFAVLQIDLLGCGDSSGDFADARWDLWKDDVEAGIDWLQLRFGVPVTLLGLRLGALLALDVAHASRRALQQVLLWNPVQSGTTFLKQFLRLLTVNDMLAEEKHKSAGGESGATADRPAPESGKARAELLGGRMLEVAGYDLAPALATAIDACEAARLAVKACPVYWIETVASLERPEAPAITRLLSQWQASGVRVDVQRVVGPSFWATQEIAMAPALIEATTALLVANATPSPAQVVA